MITVQTLNRQQLADFTASGVYHQLPDLPISPHRAQAHIRNPRAEADDPLMFLAWLGDELVGYLGVLPDQFTTADGAHVHCGWLSCLWVSDRHRGKSIAKILVSQGAAALGGQILLTEFTPVAKQLYDRLGLFADLQIREGIRLYYRLELQRLLPPKRPVFGRIKPLLSLADAVVNIALDAIRPLRKPRPAQAPFSYVTEVDAETALFIKGKQDGELFRRGQAELNWALQNPWVLKGEPDELNRRYYFTSFDRVFEFKALQVRDANGQLCAFLILSRRNGNLKMPVCYFEPGCVEHVAAVVNHHIYQWNINTFSTFHPEIVQYYQTKRTFALFKKTLKRHYLSAKPMAIRLEGQVFNIQDGDGDCFFT